MKRSIKGFFVILVIVMSFVAVQSVSAEIVSETITVTGTIDSISTNGSMILVDEIEVYGLRIKWLEKQGIDLQEIMDADSAMMVSIDGYYAVCENDALTKFVACSITVLDNDTMVELRNCPAETLEQ